MIDYLRLREPGTRPPRGTLQRSGHGRRRRRRRTKTSAARLVMKGFRGKWKLREDNPSSERTGVGRVGGTATKNQRREEESRIEVVGSREGGVSWPSRPAIRAFYFTASSRRRDEQMCRSIAPRNRSFIIATIPSDDFVTGPVPRIDRSIGDYIDANIEEPSTIQCFVERGVLGDEIRFSRRDSLTRWNHGSSRSLNVTRYRFFSRIEHSTTREKGVGEEGGTRNARVYRGECDPAVSNLGVN